MDENLTKTFISHFSHYSNFLGGEKGPDAEHPDQDIFCRPGGALPRQISGSACLPTEADPPGSVFSPSGALHIQNRGKKAKGQKFSLAQLTWWWMLNLEGASSKTNENKTYQKQHIADYQHNPMKWTPANLTRTRGQRGKECRTNNKTSILQRGNPFNPFFGGAATKNSFTQ